MLWDTNICCFPTLVYRFFTVRGVKQHYYVPFIFCLVQDKKENSYEEALQNIARYLPANYFLKKTYADFEKDIHTAVETVWPVTDLRGCRFHLGQARHHQTQKLGL